MDLTTISRVASTDRSDEATEMLESGWILLGTATGQDDRGEPYIRFALGFPGRPPIE